VPNYIFTVKDEDEISIVLNVQYDIPFVIGEKIKQINKEAYMNGYNWEAFFDYYLLKYAPELLDGMNSNPEAGTYIAFYNLTPENEEKVKKFTDIICDLLENEEKLYNIVREEGNEIKWY
jgi:hypothetical protein